MLSTNLHDYGMCLTYDYIKEQEYSNNKILTKYKYLTNDHSMPMSVVIFPPYHIFCQDSRSHILIPKVLFFGETHLRGGVIYHFFGSQITFVSDKKLVDVLARVSVNLLQPLLHVVERLLVGHVVNHDDAVSAAVVAAMNSARTTFTRGVHSKPT